MLLFIANIYNYSTIGYYMTNQTSNFNSKHFNQIHIKNLPEPISNSNCLYPNEDCENLHFSEYDFRLHVFSSYRKIN